MTEGHLVAVDTYGTQRVKNNLGHKVSAHKLGYGTCTRDVLLRLYDKAALDVTSKRATYHYVQITGDTAVHQGTLLFRLNDAQLAEVEAITRRHGGIRAGCWRWMDRPGRTDKGWNHFPSGKDGKYTPVGIGQGEGPRYDPTERRAIRPGAAQAADGGSALVIERSQRDPSDTPWWWVSGDTYPHRVALKAAGGRWSRKRKSWYFKGETLPGAVQQLVDETPPPDGAVADTPEDETVPAAPETIATAAVVEQPEPPSSCGGAYQVGDGVLAKADFRGLGDVAIQADTAGVVTACFGDAGELGYSYNVDFIGAGEVWCFEFDLAPVPTGPRPTHALGATVYTGSTVRLSVTETMPQNTLGQVVARYNLGGLDHQDVFGYGVAFAGYGVQVVFQDSLRADAMGERDLTITRHEPLRLMPGFSKDEMIAAQVARRESIANAPLLDEQTIDDDAATDDTPPTGATTPVPKPTVTASDASPDVTEAPTVNPPAEEPVADDGDGEPEAEGPPPIQVIPAPVLSEPMAAAVEAGRGATIPTTRNLPSGKAVGIAQTYVGAVTGAVTGNVHCFGYAVSGETLLYLNLGGPSTAVAAIRAKLAKGEAVNLVPWDGPAVELSPGEGASGMYTDYLVNMSEAKYTSAILVHEWITDPLYKEKATTAIFRVDEAQASAKLLDHVRRLVKIPIFDDWRGFLYTAGQSASLVRKPRSGGAVDLLVVDLDRDGWTRLVSGALASGAVTLPG